MPVNPWDFLDIPNALNNVVFGGTAIVVAQLMVTSFVVMLFILPAIFAKQSPSIIMMLAIFAILICTGLTWLPVAVMIVIIFIIALVGAKELKEWV
jgi:hypothetical protein